MGILISRYLDDEVTVEERDQITAHLRECELCDEFWQILQRNERLVQDALSETRFSKAVAENIEGRIQKAAAPHRDVRPFPRAWAAAASLLLCAGAFFAWQQARFSTTDAALADLRRELERKHQAEGGWAWQILPLYKTLEAEQQRAYADAIRGALSHRPDVVAAYVSSGVTVTARFPRASDFRAFDVRRRALSDTDFGPALNREPLLVPNWVDSTAEPGQDYEYRFTGVRADGSTADGTPVRVHVPGDAAPAQYPFELRLVDVRDGIGVAVLTPREGVEGSPQILHLRAGDEVAGFTVERFEDGDELLTATLAWPQADDEGRPIIDPATGKVKVKYEDTILSVRSNQRMVLRRGELRVSVWRQGRILLPS